MAVNYVSFLVQNIFRIEQLRTKIKLFIAFVINSSSLVILSLTFKCCIFIVFFRGFKKRKFARQIFSILSVHKPFLGSCEVPQKIWARSFQPFWRLLVKNKQTNRQTKYIYRFTPVVWIFFLNARYKWKWWGFISCCQEIQET